MSTAILRENGDGTVSAAWDSQATMGGGTSVTIVEDKVFMNDGLLFAVAGSLAALTIIKHTKFSKRKKADNKTAYIMGSLIPELRGALTLGGEESNDSGMFELDLVVGIEGELFDLSGLNTYHQRVDKLYTVGSGTEYARGAATAWADLRQAVEVAAMYDTFTGGSVREGSFSW